MLQEVKIETDLPVWFPPKALGKKMLKWKLSLFVTFRSTVAGGDLNLRMANRSPFQHFLDPGDPICSLSLSWTSPHPPVRLWDFPGHALESRSLLTVPCLSCSHVLSTWCFIVNIYVNYSFRIWDNWDNARCL